MEPGNPNHDRILEWLRGCNRHLSSARAFHASLNNGAEPIEFDNRSCSPALPTQMVSRGCEFDSVSECLSQPAAKPISSYNPSPVVHSAKKIFKEVDLSLQSPTWIKFYNISKHLLPDMTYGFEEEIINNCLLKAITQQEISLETINSIEEHLPLSDAQRQSFHRVYFECLQESAVKRLTSGVKRVTNSQYDVTASMAKTSENVLPSKVASSHTREKLLPPSSPKTQKAILIKKPIQLSSSDSRNYPELRR